MSGTIIQRTLFFDPLRCRGEDFDIGERHGFKYRLNETTEVGDDQISLRKIVTSDVKSQGNHTGLVARTSTSSFVMPMRRQQLFSAAPFKITACVMVLDLSSFEAQVIADEEMVASADSPATEDGGDAAAESAGENNFGESEKHDFQPDLICHMEDLSNLVCVKNAEMLDAMKVSERTDRARGRLASSGCRHAAASRDSLSHVAPPRAVTTPRHTPPLLPRLVGWLDLAGSSTFSRWHVCVVARHHEPVTDGRVLHRAQGRHALRQAHPDHVLHDGGLPRAAAQHRHAHHVLRLRQHDELRIFLHARRLRRRESARECFVRSPGSGRGDRQQDEDDDDDNDDDDDDDDDENVVCRPLMSACAATLRAYDRLAA